MYLTVKNYDLSEKEGKKNLSNRFLQAFQPVTFDKAGYPTRIESEDEVYRFLDTMHENRLKLYYESEYYEYAPTCIEFEIIKKVVKNIYEFSRKKYGHGIIVKATMLSSMNVLRRIKCLTVSENLPTIFEVGGGTGILGALLYETGYKYISTDITQAFYMTQNNLWEGLFPECVEESLNSVENLNEIVMEKIIHIPYWKLWELRCNELEADIMVANHCLTEMHPWSLHFYLSYGKWLMRNSKYKLFIAQSAGRFNSGNFEYLLKSFHEMGYALLYSEKDFVIFSLRSKDGILPINISDLLQKYNGSGKFPICRNEKDKTANLFENAYLDVAGKEKVSLKEIENYFVSLDGNIDSPDEEFMHYCGYDSL